MYEVTMPKLSDSMEEGKIIEWKVREGDRVKEGDVLAEVESDKAVMELECFQSGVVQRIMRGDGEEAAVGEVIATIVEGEEGEGRRKEQEHEHEQEQEHEEEQDKEEEKEQEQEKEKEKEKDKVKRTQVPKIVRRAEGPAIVPYAQRLAEQYGVDWTRIAGTWADGRITAEDVLKATPARTKAPGPEAPAQIRPSRAEAPPRGAEDEVPPLEVTEDEAEVQEAPFRLKTQARRVIASHHTIPHFYVTRGVDVTRLMEMKDELKERFGASLTHVVMFACLRALKAHPEVNRSYDRGRVIVWKVVNLGLAVDTDQGLTVAVLRDAGDCSLAEVVARTRELVERARADKLSAEERRHPTFTITNLGMFDVEHFEPIIAPPSSITLAVASALPATVVRDGAVFVGQVMKLTAACDHRIIDGAAAARFLMEVRALLEAPDDLLGGV